MTATPAEPLTEERLEEIRAHVDEYGLGAPSADAVVVELIGEVDRLRAALRRAVDHATRMEDQRDEWRRDCWAQGAEVRRLRMELDEARAEPAETATEWGLRTASGYVLGPFPTRDHATSHPHADKTIVRRTATYGPWTTEETNA